MKSLLCGISSALLVAMVTVPAHGQRLQGEAAKLKAAGDKALDSGNPDEAALSYTKAYELSKSPVLLYNRGRAYQALTRYPEALDDLREFERLAPPSLKAKVADLDSMISELGGKIATVSVECVGENSEVRLDGKVISACPMKPMRINSGTITVEVMREGFYPFKEQVDLFGGKEKSLKVVLNPRVVTARLSIRTTPPGAHVSVDDRLAGDAPADVELEKGQHKIVASYTGYRSREALLTLDPGEQKTLDITLEKPKLHEHWWFWATLGGAVVLTGVVAVVAVSTERSPHSGTLNPGVISSGLARW